MTKAFLSLKGFTRYEEKIKRSLFIGSGNVVYSEVKAKEFIKNISTEFKNATHNCWAYKVDGKIAYSDAGEPSGTAGRPIIGAIEKLELDNIVIVITRFFGGVKLGIRGLIDAYSSIALKTLRSGEIVLYVPSYKIKIEIEYPVFDRFIRFFTRIGLELKKQDFLFTDVVKGFIYVPEKKFKEFEDMASNLEKYGKVMYDTTEKLYIPKEVEVDQGD